MIDRLLVYDETTHLARPSEYAYQLDAFKNVIVRDKGSKGDSQGRKKQRASQEITYVYHMCDPRSPYFELAEQYRHDRVKKAIFKDEKWEADEIVREAISFYKDSNRTALLELLRASLEAVFKLQQYFEKLDLESIDDRGKPIYSAKDVVSNLANLGKVVAGLKELKEQVEKEQFTGDTIRKGVQVSKWNA